MGPVLVAEVTPLVPVVGSLLMLALSVALPASVPVSVALALAEPPVVGVTVTPLVGVVAEVGVVALSWLSDAPLLSPQACRRPRRVARDPGEAGHVG